MTPKQEVKQMKLQWAAYYYAHVSKDVCAISQAVHLSPEKIEAMMRSSYWDDALERWLNPPIVGDLNVALSEWTELVENGEHITPIVYASQGRGFEKCGDPEVYSLINSHLFCVDNLSEADIRERLSTEGNPIRYEDEHTIGYHYFVYPNFDDGVFSKVFARVNVVGDLVVGRGDATSLVCIRHGRLSLTRQVCDDVANVSDARLLVCR